MSCITTMPGASARSCRTFKPSTRWFLMPIARIRACRACKRTRCIPLPTSNFEFVFDSEAVNFLREVGPTGLRLNLSPEIRWSNRGPGYFFEPAVGYDFTQYDLQDVAFGSPSTPTRALPYARLDTGLVFERDAGFAGAAHANSRAAHRLQLRALPESE